MGNGKLAITISPLEKTRNQNYGISLMISSINNYITDEDTDRENASTARRAFPWGF